MTHIFTEMCWHFKIDECLLPEKQILHPKSDSKSKKTHQKVS